MNAYTNSLEERVMSFDATQYTIQYAKEKLKRVPFDVRKTYYSDVLTKAAELSGMSVNGFIKAAIQEKIARDGLDLPDIKP